MAINRVGTVCIFVADQDRAKAFYTNVLGMELRTDMPMYPGATSRWLAVAPKGAQTDIILYLPDQNWEHYPDRTAEAIGLNSDRSGRFLGRCGRWRNRLFGWPQG